MEKDFKDHIEKYISTFIPKNKRARWRYFIEKDDWGSLSAYQCIEREMKDRNIEHNLERTGLVKYLEKRVYVFPIGHGATEGGPYITTLEAALLGIERELECIISIIPGKLAISFGHSDEFRLCSRLLPDN